MSLFMRDTWLGPSLASNFLQYERDPWNHLWTWRVIYLVRYVGLVNYLYNWRSLSSKFSTIFWSRMLRIKQNDNIIFCGFVNVFHRNKTNLRLRRWQSPDNVAFQHKKTRQFFKKQFIYNWSGEERFGGFPYKKKARKLFLNFSVGINLPCEQFAWSFFDI